MPPTDGMKDPAGATWREFAAAAPELASRVKGRFAANLHHVVGTLRRTGAPRVSGTEVRIDERHLSLGMMPGSHKLADVRRDPRVEVHSAPLEEDLASGDAKVAGRLVEVPTGAGGGDDGRAGADDDAGGRGGEGGEEGVTFTLAIDRVSLVQVDGQELLVTTWSPAGGLGQLRRR